MHLPRSRGGRAGLVGLAVVVLIAGAGFVAVRKLSGNITAIDLTKGLGKRPTKAAQVVDTDAMNILVMGSDARAGQGAGFGKASVYGSSARSDTTLLVHLYKGHQQALVVSIPRDSLVTIPACLRADGSSTAPWTTKINAAFSEAGPACTIKTVEQLTGVFIDHYVVVDFRGFQKMVDAVGGVQVCLTKAVQDSKSHLDLPAGTSLLDGKTALAFVRTRYSMGDGSDTARIRRQQGFIAALTRKVKSAGVLLNPVKLFNLLDAATSSLTMDPAFASLTELQSVALSLRSLKAKDLRFVTVPASPDGSGNVVWTSRATELWTAIKNDTVWPEPGTLGFDGKPLTVDPSAVSIDVVNGGGAALVGASDSMTALGYSVHSKTDTKTPLATTSITAGPNGLESARTVAAALGITNITVDSATVSSRVTLTIGRNWTDPKAVVVNPVFKDANSTSIYGPSAGITGDNNACTRV
ncbi:MAG: LCP family protein [Candidatus Nanopelagicales bacterium]